MSIFALPSSKSFPGANSGCSFSLAVNAWVFFRISGGLFNPAVTLGLFLCGAISWYRSIILCIVQFAAAIAAAGISQLVVPGGINARTKLGSTCSLAQGFFIEMFCTSLLMFAIYMLAGEKHKATFIAPVGIGLALFLAELFATGLTGGSLNPARTLGMLSPASPTLYTCGQLLTYISTRP